MKKGDVQKLAKKTPVDLKKDLAAARSELRSMKFDLASGKVKNIGPINDVKRRIARILTFLNQKQKESENNDQDN